MEQTDRLIERCAQAIKRSKARTVGLQFAAGFRIRAVDIAKRLEEETNVSVTLCADPTFGACDIREMPVDMVVHIGHAPIPDLHYRNVFFFDDPLPPPDSLVFVEKALPLLGKKVGLLTATQFRSWLPAVKERLEREGHQVFIGKKSGRIAYDGQLIGCDYTVARSVEKDVDCFLFFGSGKFHPLAVALLTTKPVVVADYERGEARRLDKERDRALRQRHGAIAKAQSAQVFGIIVSTKMGQNRMGLAKGLLEKARKHGKAARILVMDNVSQDALEGYRVDAWVNTACPRIVIEDHALFKKPMLTPQEFEIVLGERAWEEYEMDEIRE